MKKLLSLSLVSSTLIFGIAPLKADYIIPKGTTYETQSDNFTSSSGGNTFEILEDLNCETTLFSGGYRPSLKSTTACMNLIIDKQKNLGKSVSATAAMNTAMSTLPESSPDSKYTCGVGTGSNSGIYALGIGCSTNINENLSFNSGGSLALHDSKDSGSGMIENYGIKAGFIYKFGPKSSNNLISQERIKAFEQKIMNLESKNDLINAQNQALMARLERLEKIALSETQSKDLATIKLP